MHGSHAVGVVRPMQDRQWLMVGKGPSFSRLDTLNLDRYHVLTLNHAWLPVSLRTKVAVAFFMDLDPALECAAEFTEERSPTYVCLPWRPHQQFKPGPTLSELFAKITRPDEPLAKIQQRIISFNSTTAGNRPKHPRLPTLEVRGFSAVGAFNLLAVAGIPVVESVGVDGGNDYAAGFDTRDLLANGKASFDEQFVYIRRIGARRGTKLVKR